MEIPQKINKKAIKQAVIDSFKGEIEALKPGNVSVYAAGHGMSADDFILSARVSTPALCMAGAGVGRRILAGVKATRSALDCNTNLGMLLLFAPIVKAAEQGFADEDQLREKLAATLAGLTDRDTAEVFAAIRLADPGGLGEAGAHDVRRPPDCSLLRAMTAAADRDSVARQYSNNFAQIFGPGLANIKYFFKLWNHVEWATVACYLTFLSALPDSHIQRKYGRREAENLLAEAKDLTAEYKQATDPASCIGRLQNFDRRLKIKKYNPGTTADLTAASLLVYNLLTGPTMAKSSESIKNADDESLLVIADNRRGKSLFI